MFGWVPYRILNINHKKELPLEPLGTLLGEDSSNTSNLRWYSHGNHTRSGNDQRPMSFGTTIWHRSHLMEMTPRSLQATHGLESSSVLGLPYRILNINHKKKVLLEPMGIEPCWTSKEQQKFRSRAEVRAPVGSSRMSRFRV